MKKFYIGLLLFLMILPLIPFNEVKADSYTYNKSYVVDSTNESIEPNVGVSVTNSGRTVRYNSTTGFFDTGTSFSSSYNQYALEEDHIYYWAMEYSSLVPSTQFSIIYSNYVVQNVYANNDDSPILQTVFTASYGLNANLAYYTGGSGTLTVVNSVLIDLTEAFGYGYEFSLSQLMDVDFYNTWDIYDYYNVYDSSTDIYELSAYRTLENLIENGDFSDGTTGWLETDADNHVSIVDGKGIVNTDGITASNEYLSQYIDIYAHTYYYSVDYEVVSYVSGSKGISVYYGGVGNIRFDFGFNTVETLTYSEIDTFTSEYTSYLRLGKIYNSLAEFEVHFDNVMVFDLMSSYSLGNEPSQIYLDTLFNGDYYDEFTYEDLSYYTLVDNTNFYQYEDAIVDFTLTETLVQNATDPLIYIEKYSLSGNFLGIIYDGTIDNATLNGSGFYEHNFNYELPSPTASEDGYTYTVRNGEDGSILTAGYVLEDDAISGLYTFDGFEEDNPNRYIFNDNNMIEMHYTLDTVDLVDDMSLVVYSENDNAFEVYDLDAIHNGFNPSYDGSTISSYFYLASDDSRPYLIDYLDGEDYIGNHISDVISTYDSYCTNFISGSPEWINVNAYYTYKTYNNTEDSLIDIGLTPIFYTDEIRLYDMSMVNTSIRQSYNAIINITKNDERIDDIYDSQSLYDFNTRRTYTTYFDDYESEIQIRIQIIESFALEDSYFEYYLEKGTVYKNGASNSDYDFTFRTDYEIRLPTPIEESINGFLSPLGLNTTIGKGLVVIIVMLGTSILLGLWTKNFIVVLINLFVLSGFFMLIGFMPIWIILTEIIFIILMVFISVSRN